MSIYNLFSYGTGVSEELGAHILELPYTGEAVSMYILLPPFISGENGFNAMVERLNASLLHEAFNNMWRTQIKVVIPKFKLEQMVENELIEVSVAPTPLLLLLHVQYIVFVILHVCYCSRVLSLVLFLVW